MTRTPDAPEDEPRKDRHVHLLRVIALHTQHAVDRDRDGDVKAGPHSSALRSRAVRARRQLARARGRRTDG
jgi:hypothetical protein